MPRFVISLHRVFHSIRFKVNKRLGLSGAPFFMSLIFLYFHFRLNEFDETFKNGIA